MTLFTKMSHLNYSGIDLLLIQCIRRKQPLSVGYFQNRHVVEHKKCVFGCGNGGNCMRKRIYTADELKWLAGSGQQR